MAGFSGPALWTGPETAAPVLGQSKARESAFKTETFTTVKAELWNFMAVFLHGKIPKSLKKPGFIGPNRDKAKGLLDIYSGYFCN